MNKAKGLCRPYDVNKYSEVPRAPGDPRPRDIVIGPHHEVEPPNPSDSVRHAFQGKRPTNKPGSTKRKLARIRKAKAKAALAATSGSDVGSNIAQDEATQLGGQSGASDAGGYGYDSEFTSEYGLQAETKTEVDETVKIEMAEPVGTAIEDDPVQVSYISDDYGRASSEDSADTPGL